MALQGRGCGASGRQPFRGPGAASSSLDSGPRTPSQAPHAHRGAPGVVHASPAPALATPQSHRSQQTAAEPLSLLPRCAGVAANGGHHCPCQHHPMRLPGVQAVSWHNQARGLPRASSLPMEACRGVAVQGQVLGYPLHGMSHGMMNPACFRHHGATVSKEATAPQLHHYWRVQHDLLSLNCLIPAAAGTEMVAERRGADVHAALQTKDDGGHHGRQHAAQVP